MAQGFIQYSFYQVVAAGVLYIVSQFNFWHHPRTDNGAHLTNRSHQDIARAGGHVPGRNLRDIKVPMLTSHIFSGTSGGSSTNLFDTVSRALGAAA